MNWKDYTSLAAVIFVLAVIGAIILQLPIAQLTDWRPPTILLTILALFIFFTISPMVASTSKPESISTAVLGLIALVLAVVGVIISDKILFIVFAVNLVVPWSLTIYYHVQAHTSSNNN